jgi:hypothetical protein
LTRKDDLLSLPLRDPDPPIIRMLRALRAGDSDSLRSAMGELDAILEQWIQHESIAELRTSLLGTARANRRRTQKTVDREYGLYMGVLNAAREGRDVTTFQLAADAVNADEKTVERAWKKWAPAHVPLLQKGARRDDEFKEMYKAMLARLPPFDMK